MSIKFVILVFVGIGLYYFFIKYREIKKYASLFLEIIGVVFGFYVFVLIWKLFIYDQPTTFKEFFTNLIVYGRNIILASVGAGLLAKQNLPIMLLILDGSKNKIQYQSHLYAGLLSAVFMILITIILLVVSSQSIFKLKFIAFDDWIIVAFHAFLVSFAEELFHRLFLQAMLLNWLRKVPYGIILSIILTSTIWAISHVGVLESGGIKFVQIFLFGIILGTLMIKKGLESCVVAHMVFNIVAEIYLGHFRVMSG